MCFVLLLTPDFNPQILQQYTFLFHHHISLNHSLSNFRSVPSNVVNAVSALGHLILCVDLKFHLNQKHEVVDRVHEEYN